MMSSIQSMLEHYQPKTAEAYRNALKEYANGTRTDALRQDVHHGHPHHS